MIKINLKIFHSKIFFSCLLVLLVLLLVLCVKGADGNECIPCPPAGTNDSVCGADDKGNFEVFRSECLLRFRNCDQKTSKFIF